VIMHVSTHKHNEDTGRGTKKHIVNGFKVKYSWSASRTENLLSQRLPRIQTPSPRRRIYVFRRKHGNARESAS